MISETHAMTLSRYKNKNNLIVEINFVPGHKKIPSFL